jgi:drug/metabolite transporter (DMT)-like permease
LNPKLKPALQTLAAVLLWGTAPIGTRYLVGNNHIGLPAIPFVALRYFLALPAFVALAVWGRAWLWSRRDWKLGAVCALVGVTGYNLPNALGTATVSAGMIGLLNGAEPLMIVLLMALLHRRMPGRWTVLAGITGLAGIVLLAHGAGPALGDAKGIALVLFGALNWSVYCVLVPPLLHRRGAMMVTAVTMSIGTLPMVLVGASGMPEVVSRLSLPQWEILLALSSTAILAIFCWNAGSKGLGTEQSGWFLYLLPVVSLAGGVLFLHEPLTGVEFFGGGLIMASVLMSQRMGRTP